MKRYGIRMTLPPNDPMRLPHLLGEDWQSYRWYGTEREREEALGELQKEHIYSRRGDIPSLVLTKVDAEAEDSQNPSN
jgi:hypothetical protein